MKLFRNIRFLSKIDVGKILANHKALISIQKARITRQTNEQNDERVFVSKALKRITARLRKLEIKND